MRKPKQVEGKRKEALFIMGIRLALVFSSETLGGHKMMAKDY